MDEKDPKYEQNANKQKSKNLESFQQAVLIYLIATAGVKVIVKKQKKTAEKTYQIQLVDLLVLNGETVQFSQNVETQANNILITDTSDQRLRRFERNKIALAFNDLVEVATTLGFEFSEKNTRKSQKTIRMKKITTVKKDGKTIIDQKDIEPIGISVNNFIVANYKEGRCVCDERLVDDIQSHIPSQLSWKNVSERYQGNGYPLMDTSIAQPLVQIIPQQQIQQQVGEVLEPVTHLKIEQPIECENVMMSAINNDEDDGDEYQSVSDDDILLDEEPQPIQMVTPSDLNTPIQIEYNQPINQINTIQFEELKNVKSETSSDFACPINPIPLPQENIVFPNFVRGDVKMSQDINQEMRMSQDEPTFGFNFSKADDDVRTSRDQVDSFFTPNEFNSFSKFGKGTLYK
ncbi:hypothetical protein EIN_129320 [Entamoeba invadens IP1]|uniref:Uncharacterized protein n=1 Tax=Entamoeba invadens IP1 TaxID=370355 RepID=L7FMN4_ENTIV|nr:hypothetical protein EIN_129320 [Entamoeba invadens IP1]ELP91592.1 hypothetical protein EIN_129320 [Entamoeba invadens IP1]|eukprot:XP_004258363.1 hypothetical protein EIN_129320 [Entamoeba invadens IP1]